MKDFIIENQDFISSKELVQIAVQTNENTKDIDKIKSQMATKEDLKKVMDIRLKQMLPIQKYISQQRKAFM